MRSGFFLSDSATSVNRPSAYFLTFFLVVLAYAIIGQLPLTLIVTMNPQAMEAYQSGSLFGLADVLGKNQLLTLLILPFVFSLLALMLSAKFVHIWSVRSLFTSADRFDWKRFFLSFGIWGSILLIFLYVINFKTGKIFWNFNSSTFLPLLLISLILIPIQTTCEEVLFRSYLMKAFTRSLGKAWIAVLLSGVLFGLVHSSNPEIESLGMIAMVYYILTGIFLGVLAWKDNGLELSMGYHAINNIFSALILTNDWQAFQTDALFKDYNEPSFGWDSLLTVLIIQPLLIFIFSRVYGWKWSRQSLEG
jgi:membrane protease YdiL (CAAX protease family)